MFKFIEKCQSQGMHPDIFAKHTYFLLIMRSKDAFQEIIGSQKYEFMKALVPWCHAVVKTCRKYVSLWINVSFITFFVFGFWSLLATKLRKYKNISKSSFTFCQERWARQKKRERKSNNKFHTEMYGFYIQWSKIVQHWIRENIPSQSQIN